jgi:phosphopantetheinyl transferase
MNRIEVPWPNVLVLRGPVDPVGLTVPDFASEKRRREWILSRTALEMLGAAPYSSLSHSGDYAAAVIGNAPVGVDVQVVRPLSERAAHLFLADEEQSDMERCAIANRIIHFFCAKEAAWKARGGAIPTLKQIPLKLKEETATGLLFDAAATYATADIIVAVTVPA